MENKENILVIDDDDDNENEKTKSTDLQNENENKKEGLFDAIYDEIRQTMLEFESEEK